MSQKLTIKSKPNCRHTQINPPIRYLYIKLLVGAVCFSNRVLTTSDVLQMWVQQNHTPYDSAKFPIVFQNFKRDNFSFLPFFFLTQVCRRRVPKAFVSLGLNGPLRTDHVSPKVYRFTFLLSLQLLANRIGRHFSVFTTF